MARLYVIDAGSLCAWQYFAHETEEDGMLVGVQHWLTRFRQHTEASHMVVCYDAGHDRRTAIDPEYKLARKTKPKPEAFIEQLRQAPDAISNTGVPGIRIGGEEADDVIASVVAAHSLGDTEIIVVSSDKDLSALVTDGVQRYDPKTEKFYDEAGVVEHMGVPPWRVCDLLAMAGDATDGIHGIKGIGEVRAKAAIRQTKSMTELFRKAETRTLADLSEKTQATIADGRQQYEAALKLTTLYRSLTVPVELDAFALANG